MTITIHSENYSTIRYVFLSYIISKIISNSIYIDYSFMEQKKKILEQQAEIQRQKQQQSKNYFGYSPKPQFNAPQNFSTSPQASSSSPSMQNFKKSSASTYPPAYYPPPPPSNYPPATYPDSRFSFK